MDQTWVPSRWVPSKHKEVAALFVNNAFPPGYQAKRNFVNAFLLRFKQKGDETRLTDAVELESMFRAQTQTQTHVTQRVPQNKRRELIDVLQQLSDFLTRNTIDLIKELTRIDKAKTLAVAAAARASRAARGVGRASRASRAVIQIQSFICIQSYDSHPEL